MIHRCRTPLVLLALLGILLSPFAPLLTAPPPGGTPRSALSTLLAPLAPLFTPRSAQAQVSDGASFGSAVPCLEAPDQFATTQFAIPDAAQNAKPSDAALKTFTTSGQTVKATIGQVGSIYGLALDDGSKSGVKRLFLGAYAKRLAAMGPLGAGGIYALDLGTGAVTQYTTLPNTTNPGQTTNLVGKTSLGDMEISPDGTRMYVVNLDQKRLDIVDVATANPATKYLGNVPINLSLISSTPAVQTDLRPMGLDFQPNTNLLYIGLIDAHERDGGMPRAYVITLDITTNAQALVLNQDLGATPLQSRLNGPSTPWYAWDYNGRPWGQNGSRIVNHPEPMLSDIQFIGTTGKMVLGFRDRMGDMFYTQNPPPPSENSALAQGDALLYSANGSGGWTLNAGTTPDSSDFVNDNYVGSAPSGGRHDENFMGALTTTIDGALGSQTTQMVGTVLTPVNNETMGASWYQVNPLQTSRVTAVELIAPGAIGAGKAASLGDLENLCTAAFVGDFVWRDANGNGVQDAGESGVPNVQMALLDAGGTIVATATTDANGGYFFAVAPGQGYTVKVRDANFQSGGALNGLSIAPRDQGGDDTRDSDADEIAHTIRIPAQNRDARTYTFDVGVIDPNLANGTVGDFVWNDLNSNGVQDAGEPGVAGVRVNLIDTVSGLVTKTTTTDAAGSYVFRQVVPGTYVVQFVPAAGITATARDAGGNDATDSDADATTAWKTPAFTVVGGTVNTTLDLGLIANANVRITKTGPATVNAGATVQYTLTYVNDGPAIARNVAVVDTLPAGLGFVSSTPRFPDAASGQTYTWVVGDLAAGQGGTFVITAQLSPGAPTTFQNCAQISTASSGDTPSDNGACASTGQQFPNVAITKTGPATTQIGDQITYNLSYVNNGQAPATGVAVVDTLPTGVAFVTSTPIPNAATGQTYTWVVGTLAPGQSGSIPVTVRIDPAVAATFQNCAQVSTTAPGDTPGDNQSCVSTQVQGVNVQIVKTGTPSAAFVDDLVTYTLFYANDGPGRADNVTVTDLLPNGLAFVDSTPPIASADFDPQGINLGWSFGTLNPGESGTITLRVKVTSDAAATVTNGATVGTSTFGDNPNDNRSQTTTTIRRPNLTVTKTGPASAQYGDTISYVITASNTTSDPAANANVVDYLPANLTFVSATPAPTSVTPGSQGRTDVFWDLGTFGGATTQTFTVQATVGTGAVTPVVNYAQVSTTTSGEDPSDNIAQWTTTIPSPNITVAKTGPVTAQVGETFTYNLLVTNTGPGRADDVRAQDTLPNGLTVLSATPAAGGASGQTFYWAFGPLDAGASIPISMQVRVDPTVADTIINVFDGSTASPGDDLSDNHAEWTTTIPRPNVTIVKSGPASATVGDDLTYTLAYTNNGAADAQAVQLVDTMPPGFILISESLSAVSVVGQQITWDLGTLAPGATGSITLVLRSDATSPDQTVAINAADITTPTPGDDPTDNHAEASTLLQRTDVAVSKSSPSSFPVISGSPVTYHLDYANGGNVAALNVVLVDTVPAELANVTWQCVSGCTVTGSGNDLRVDLGTLQPNATGRVVVTGVATTTLAQTDITNTATITTDTPETTTANNTSSVTGAVQTPDVAIIKTADPQAVAGTTFVARLDYRNNGPSLATNVIVTDTLPVGVTFISATRGTASIVGSTITWNVGDLADAQSGSISLVLRADADVPDATVLLNQSGVTTDGPDRDLSNNTSDAPTAIIAQSDLSIVKTGAAIVTAGQPIPYTLSYDASGPSVARSAVVTDTLPAGLTFLSANPTPDRINGQVLAWDVGDLAPGTSGTITVNAATSATQTQASQVVTNTVDIGSPTDDPTLTNNTSTHTTTIETVDVTVVKTAPATVIAGTSMTVTLAYANAGPATATSVVLTDTLPAGLTIVSSSPTAGGTPAAPTWDLGDLAVGASGQVQLVLQVSTTAISGTTYVNVGTIATDGPDRDPTNDRSQTITRVQTVADVAVVKTGTTGPVLAGSLVAYQLAYRNSGPSQASNVVIVDTPPTGFTLRSALPPPVVAPNGTMTWAIGSLPNGSSGVISLTGVLTTSLASTDLDNTATITSRDTDPQPTNNTSTATTTVQTPDLAVTKTAPAGPLVSGSTLAYVLTYTNNGPIAAPAATVTDALPTGFTLLSAMPVPSQAGGVLTWDVGAVAVGAQGTIVVTGTLTTALATEDIANTARILPRTVTDPDPTNNTSTATTTVQTLDLAVIKTVDRATVKGGEPLTYTLDLRNNGPLSATIMVVTDTLPLGTTFVSANPAPDAVAGQLLRWDRAAFAAGTTASWTVTVQVAPDLADGTRLTNTATVTGSDPDRDLSNNTSTAVSFVGTAADLALVKTGTIGPLKSGAPVQYTLVYTNTGPSTALAADVVDTLPSGFAATGMSPGGNVNGQAITWSLGDLAPGQTGVLTLTGTLSSRNLDEVLTNGAQITSVTPDPDPTNNPGTWDIEVQRPDLRVTKSDGLTAAQPGDVLTYTITVENSGPLTATGVLLTETPPVSATVQALGWAPQGDGTWTQPIGDVGPGELLTRTFTLTLPPVVTGSTVVNAVRVQHDDPDPTPDDTTALDLDRLDAGQVGDTVWIDTNGNGVQDAGEAGMPFVSIELLDTAGTVLLNATTDAQGHYLFAGLRLGTYTIRITPSQAAGAPFTQYTLTTSATPQTTLNTATASDLGLDIGLQPKTTTAVVLAYLKVDADGADQVLRWGTVSEHDTRAFRVLRGTSRTVADATELGTRTSQGSRGGDYRLRDVGAPGGAFYWLIEVERGGKETTYGPVQLRTPETAAQNQPFRLFLPLTSN